MLQGDSRKSTVKLVLTSLLGDEMDCHDVTNEVEDERGKRDQEHPVRQTLDPPQNLQYLVQRPLVHSEIKVLLGANRCY